MFYDFIHAAFHIPIKTRTYSVTYFLEINTFVFSIRFKYDRIARIVFYRGIETNEKYTVMDTEIFFHML